MTEKIEFGAREDDAGDARREGLEGSASVRKGGFIVTDVIHVCVFFGGSNAPTNFCEKNSSLQDQNFLLVSRQYDLTYSLLPVRGDTLYLTDTRGCPAADRLSVSM